MTLAGPLRVSVRALLTAAVLAFSVSTACGETQSALGNPTEASQPPAPADPVIEVATARIWRGQIVQRISAPGSLMARRESLIGPEVQGRIRAVHVSEGDRVEAGAPLFEIDPEPYEFALGRARAALDRVRAERRQIEADLKRAQQLRSKNVLAEQESERLVNALDVARAAEREAAQAVSIAELNLERTVVRAPYTGSVAKRLADEGTTALVQPQTVVIVFQETSELEAHATIPEVYFAAIRVGDAALLYVEGLPLPLQVDVTAVSDAIDMATRTFLVVMKVPNPDFKLKAGVFARVEILPKAKSHVILVPREALRTEDGQTHVLAVRDGRAVATPIKVGIVSEDVVEVIRGLREGDEVIIGEAARSMGPGMRVRAVEGGRDRAS
jgi:membrane fusion protein (multidrug efflux system)